MAPSAAVTNATRQFTSDNEVWANPWYRAQSVIHKKNAAEGVCMGAAVQWCYFALTGKFEHNPMHPINIGWSKNLATYYLGIHTDSALTHTDNIQLLAKAGIQGEHPIATQNQVIAQDIINHMKNNPGIYLILGCTHYMAGSTLTGSIYFYDNENGLYKCNNLTAFESQIKRNRADEIEYNSGYSRELGASWSCYICKNIIGWQASAWS